MQENPKGTPKLGRVRRVHNAITSEVTGKNPSDATLSSVRATTSRNRTTMMPGDIMQIQKLPKKKIAASNRQSIMPSQLPLDVQKKVDTESKELELGFLYDEYLQTIMMDLVIKKKIEEKKHLTIAQLATIAREIDQDTTKLIKIKTREHDVVNLSLAQKEIDMQLAAVTKYTKDKAFNIVKDTLFKLHSLLEPLDVLQCNSIILPETSDEWKEAREVLTKCSNILKNITNLIGSKGKVYCNVNDGLKTFVEIYNEVESLKKKLEETLCNLQVLILKNASHSLTQNEN